MAAVNPLVGAMPVGTSRSNPGSVAVPAGGADGIADGTELYVAAIVLLALIVLFGFSKAGFRTVIAANVKVGK